MQFGFYCGYSKECRLAPWKDKSVGTVTLPQLLCGRKRQGRSSPESCELVRVQETRWLQRLQTVVTAERLHSTQESVETLSVNTQPLQPPGHWVPGSSTAAAGAGCWRAVGGWGCSRLPAGQLTAGSLVIYNLIQTTVSDLKDLIYFLSPL